ncbi:MAG: HAD-IIIC family phosphatase, partial [Planctomycetaceae bacterium]
MDGDAGDPAWCRDVIRRIREERGRLDLLVLNACAPPGQIQLTSDQTGVIARYVAENLALAMEPLACWQSTLDGADGRIVAISSAAVEMAPRGWSHYVSLKLAVEGLVKGVVRDNSRVSGFVLRPSKLLTAWQDTPTGVLGAIPPSWVAASLLEALAIPTGNERLVVQSNFPQPEISATTLDESGPVDFQLVLAGSFTTDPIVKSLRFWLGELSLNGRVVLAPYGQILQQLLNHASELSTNTRGLGVILLRVQDWLREVPEQQAEDPGELARFLEQTVEAYAQAFQVHRSRCHTPTLLLLCPSADTLPKPQQDAVDRATTDLMRALKSVAGVTTLRSIDFHEHYSVSSVAIHDAIRDEIGHIPYQAGYFHLLGSLVARQLKRHLAAPRKVVVVDCDNTLWRGVVGEVGPEGVQFDPHHRLLQSTLVRLSKSGVLICLCSKNEEFDVWSVFDQRPDFLLPRDAVVGALINWLPKSQNLRTLATRLNLGIDSFLFLDDNPVECAEVRANTPEVLTLQFPTDATAASKLIHHLWEFDTSSGTSEDQKRTRMYQEELQRQELQVQTGSFREFINNLNLSVQIKPVVESEVARAAQLTIRTNQFNFLTRRRDESQLRPLLAEGRYEVLTVHVTDRFGDYGLVGLMICEEQPECLFVDTFLLSCRVLGRGVEHRMVAELGRLAISRGLSTVRMEVHFTPRNAPARAFVETIAGLATVTREKQSLRADFPAAQLAEVTWEPNEAPPPVVEEARDHVTAQALPAVKGFRDRERQICRTAFELSTLEDLRSAIDDETEPKPGPIANDAVETIVTNAFSKALKLAAETVRRVDLLENMGCSSFKIVEITVELLSQFPNLPSTLLFEHRSVSAIIDQIVSLQSATDRGNQSPAREAPVAQPQATGSLVAVVGMAVRCAGANSPEELWQLLSEGRTAVRAVPSRRSAFLDELRDHRPHWAGLIEDIEGFDAAFFGISPREAESLDPQLRLFLQTAWWALEDAGLTGCRVEPKTGVYAAVMYGDYLHAANAVAEATGNPYRSWEGFSLANRLSQLLGFSGPSLAVDTACSSSGTALHLAMRALIAGECRAAVVGGVNLILDPNRFVQMGKLGILSENGHCVPFGSEANGTVLGEGCGVVVLRPLADAVAAGDVIHGVLLASALTTGHGTVGFTAPDPVAQ